MTRGRKNTGRKGLVEQIFRGNTIFLTSTVAGASLQRVVGLHPRNLQDDRAIEQADIYECFRFIKFSVQAMGANNNGIVVSYRPGLTVDSTPVNVEQVSTADRMVCTLPDQTFPARLRLRAPELRGEKEYYGTTDTTDLPGAFFISSFSTAGATVATDVQLIFRYVIAFYGPVDPAITYRRMAARYGALPLALPDSSSDSEEIVVTRRKSKHKEQPLPKHASA